VSAWLRGWLGRLALRRTKSPTFACVLERTLRDDDGLTLRLSTVERSVGLDLERPPARAALED
jgi:hypothetical protein